MSDNSRVGESKHSQLSGTSHRPAPSGKSTPGKGKGDRPGLKKASIIVFVGHS